MAKPNRTCFGRGMCLHIGHCCDFWVDDGMCVCNPVDAAEYPNEQRLYAGGGVRGFASPNIRTIFPNGSDKIHTFNRGDYCWVYWNWDSSTFGTVKFELRDGNTVKATRSTKIVAAPAPAGSLELVKLKSQSGDVVSADRGCTILGSWRNLTGTDANFNVAVIVDGVEYYKTEWIQAGNASSTMFYVRFDTPGTYEITATNNPNNLRASVTALQASTIKIKTTPPVSLLAKIGKAQLLTHQTWGSTNDIDFSHGIYNFEIATIPDGYRVTSTSIPEGEFTHDKDLTILVELEQIPEPKVCTEGEKRNPTTCWDSSTIHGEVCRNNAWVPTGETCPPKPECTEGDKKDGYVCVDGKWCIAPEPDEPVPEPAECTDGDKKAGYICKDGKWVPYTPPVVPPVVPPVTPPVTPPKYLTPEQADERIRAGLPCYIKCVLPLLDTLPGIPYTPGMWVPTFCAITTEQ
ncbi:MAG: hypothetical protein U9R15_18260 [Chloroflexota bacterium]|nr:hypothetical protein [Chloroflexota bacterium]